MFVEFFAFNTQLPEMAILASKDFTAARELLAFIAKYGIDLTNQ